MAIGLWGLGVLAGVWLLERYAFRAGEPGAPPRSWPAQALVSAVQGRANLVMSLHPHCPCSRASLAELGRLLARAQDRLSVHLLFVVPPDGPPGWEQTALWNEARRIPGVRAYTDAGGLISRRFGARTSGQAVLYDALGRFAFAGGITPSRGHVGDNPGHARVLELLGRWHPSHGPTAERTAVFGCPLLETP